MNKATLKTIGIILLFTFISLVILKYYLDRHNLKKEHRFTIGSVYRFEVLAKSGYDLYFNYYVKEKKYESDYIVYKNPKSFVDKRFFVNFSPSNPQNCRLLIGTPVPDNIKNAPPEGWERIPEYKATD